MVLKVKFIFIMNRFIMNRRAGQGRVRGAGLPLALALTFVLGAGAPAGWAQSQAASDSTQSASTQSAAPTAPAANDPPSPPTDANADTEAMFPHFKDLDTRFHAAIQQAVAEENARWNHRGSVNASAELAGVRPAGLTPRDSPMVQTAIAVSRALEIEEALHEGSTDSNVPMNLKIPAITIGGGRAGPLA